LSRLELALPQPELGQASILAGGSATESALKQLAPKFRVLHLATHGYFLQDRCDSSLRSLRSLTKEGLGGNLDSLLTPGESPLLLSGLALAGANRRAEAGPDDEDGILTAEEIASLDLSSVEWVVLSACETGVGEIQTGEGVLGLRRAFEVAGAGTLIMSLWRVEDEFTREWMLQLYQERSKGRMTAEAVRNASLTLVNSRHAKGKGTHPFYWGAFVAAGDWR
ncbi:MAG: CHAT domain-containing protein, partial [Acidobacteria bacterium]|nr:CHAT domain-containing protein [Acidobacteriota bacterium]